MSNPWEKISSDDYENHMKLDSVRQLQGMNEMMKSQFDAYPIASVMIFGIAVGNGLEHIPLSKLKKVYGMSLRKVHGVLPTIPALRHSRQGRLFFHE